MTNKTLARILYLTLISIMIVTTILALIYGGNIADFYALLSGISILLTLIPLWLANRVFQNSTFSDVLDQKKLLWGWGIFILSIPSNCLVIYLTIYEIVSPHHSGVIL